MVVARVVVVVVVVGIVVIGIILILCEIGFFFIGIICVFVIPFSIVVTTCSGYIPGSIGDNLTGVNGFKTSGRLGATGCGLT